ncbi:MAG: beta-ketoacyl-[acyl-carrier-protein] synthase family protein [Prevotellaceae bacterium]|nr:beta-ketoacyl-[acyl-carrier-protein] synthase family protein [Prevotellaceae bacterium]
MRIAESHVAITGAGIISAIGEGKEETLRSLMRRRSGIGRMCYLQSVHKELPVGEVKMSNEQMKCKLGIPLEKDVSRTPLMAMLAIRESMEDAGFDAVMLQERNTALISGTTVGGMDITELHFINDDLDGDTSFFSQHDCGGSTEVIAKYFGCFSQATTISTACSSASNAIIVGAEMIKNGEADVVVAGGTEALSLFHLNGFNSLMILDPNPCRPFDSTRAGINLGEGAAYIIMEREEDARERGAKIFAYMAGWGNACDAYHQTAMSPQGFGAQLAMREALRMSGLSADDIQYVNAHGTGTPNNDQSEAEALLAVFGDSLPPVSSTKGLTAHATSASGGIEAVICLLAMEHHFIPSNVGWKHPMDGGFIPCMGADGVYLKNVLSNSFGFGGNDSALIFSASPAPPAYEETMATQDENIRQSAVVEVKSEEELTDMGKYIKPFEARRMGKLMKASILSSLKALEKAGIEVPDAIVTATAYGQVCNSEHLLASLAGSKEMTVSPTLFMQSTHNTLSANIAIQTHCHGYNITYSHGRASLEWALRDARRLIRSGRCGNVLVGYHDECTPLFRRLKGEVTQELYSMSIVLSCSK